MNSDQIRDTKEPEIYWWLREIAAQLAELNERLAKQEKSAEFNRRPDSL